MRIFWFVLNVTFLVWLHLEPFPKASPELYPYWVGYLSLGWVSAFLALTGLQEDVPWDKRSSWALVGMVPGLVCHWIGAFIALNTPSIPYYKIWASLFFASGIVGTLGLAAMVLARWIMRLNKWDGQ